MSIYLRKSCACGSKSLEIFLTFISLDIFFGNYSNILIKFSLVVLRQKHGNQNKIRDDYTGVVWNRSLPKCLLLLLFICRCH